MKMFSASKSTLHSFSAGSKSRNFLEEQYLSPPRNHFEDSLPRTTSALSYDVEIPYVNSDHMMDTLRFPTTAVQYT